VLESERAIVARADFTAPCLSSKACRAHLADGAIWRYSKRHHGN
jgi:hypothetical protein